MFDGFSLSLSKITKKKSVRSNWNFQCNQMKMIPSFGDFAAAAAAASRQFSKDFLTSLLFTQTKCRKMDLNVLLSKMIRAK